MFYIAEKGDGGENKGNDLTGWRASQTEGDTRIGGVTERVKAGSRELICLKEVPLDWNDGEQRREERTLGY